MLNKKPDTMDHCCRLKVWKVEKYTIQGNLNYITESNDKSLGSKSEFECSLVNW